MSKAETLIYSTEDGIVIDKRDVQKKKALFPIVLSFGGSVIVENAIENLNCEEHLAEKLCIVAESNREDILNTRVKDFYDIYKLKGGKYDYERWCDFG